MKMIGNIITTIAWVAFILSMYTLEANMILALITMFISGAWLLCYGWWQEEERRYKEGRR